MNKKELKVLEFLAENQDRRTTGQELAMQLGFSQRSIRTYIRNIEAECKTHGASIDAKPGYGYQLSLEDPEAFERFMLEQNHVSYPGEVPTKVDDADLRRKWMMEQMLIHEQALEMETILSRFYVSESTIKKDVQTLRALCEPYELKLRAEKGKLFIQGAEQNKRSMIMEQFFHAPKLSSLQDYLDSSPLFLNLPTSTLLRVLLEETRKTKNRFSDVQLQNILLHLALSIHRVMKGKTICTPDLRKVKTDSNAWQIANNILNQVSQEMNLEFPKSEVHYLALHFSVLNEGEIPREKIKHEIDMILEMLEEDEILDVREDKLLKEALIDHMIPMILRIRNNIQMENPLTEEIRQTSPNMFNITRKYFSMMPSLRRYTLIDDEWAYLTLHLQAAKERVLQKRKLQVLVICASGYGASQLLKSRINKIFGDELHIVSEAGYFDMNEETLKGVDLIISSINIGAVIFGIPFLHVSIFIDEEDQTKIRSYIDKHRQKQKKGLRLSPTLKSHGIRKEVLKKYFHPDRFKIVEGHPLAKEVVNELIEMLLPGEENGFDAQMKEQIAIRHQLGDMAFSDSIAVVHPAIPLAKKAKFALAIIPQGAWWSNERPEIKLLFLMSPSRYGNEDLDQITKAIVELIDREDLQRQIIDQPLFDTFQTILLECMEE